jgi:phospholipid/cholesterol/gamma-HCH transport system substrate-binding protein
MSFRSKDKVNFYKTGFFISLLSIVIMVMIISIGKENSLFESKTHLRAKVLNVQNLKIGSYVELKGIRVGSINDIRILSDDEVEISFSVLTSELKWIKKDSKVSISTAGLVGDKYLEIYGGTSDSGILDPDKDYLVSEKFSDIKQIISKGDSIATTTERILTKLDVILTHLDDGKKIVETIDSLHKTSKNLSLITSDIRQSNLGTTIHKLDRTTSSMEKIMSRIENGPGTLNSLIYDDGLHDDLRSLLGGASRNKILKYFIRESIKNSEGQKEKRNK